MENLTGGTPPVRYLPCVVPCKLYFPIDYKTVDLMIHASFYFYQKLIENWDGTIYSMQVLDNIEIALYAAWNSLLRK